MLNAAPRAQAGAQRALSLKRRVTWLLLATVAVFVVIQGVLAVMSMHDQEDELVDEITAAEARRLADRLQRNGLDLLRSDDPQALAEHFSAWWVGPQGQALPGPVPEPLRQLSFGPHRLPMGAGMEAGELHVVVLPLQGGRLLVQYDAEHNEAKVLEFGLLILGLSLSCLVVAALLAHHLAAAVVAPLERVTRLLDRWAPAAGPHTETRLALDEEAQLLDAFGRVQARLEQELAREREYLANLRHELRTPLTALRTDLEMLGLPAAGRDPQAGQARLQRALLAVDAVAAALSAVRPPDATDPSLTRRVDLARCIQDAWDSLGELPARQGLSLALDLPVNAQGQAQAWVERHALLTLLRNLMGNAAEHAAPATCRVQLLPRRMGWCLVLQDNGPGVPEAELPLLFERHWRGRLADSREPAGASAGRAGAPERGLGLAIARQMADSHGWPLRALAAPGGGLRFELELPAPPDAAAGFDENSTKP